MVARRPCAVVVGSLALVAASLGLAPEAGPAAAATTAPGFTTGTAVGGLSEPVGAAFAPDGTAFLALKTGVIKSFDHSAATGQFESAATATDFADLTAEVSNYGDRGLTGITVDPQFPTRPYVYVNYTYDKDPVTGQVYGGTQAYDNCGPDDSDEASVTLPYQRGCPAQIRVSRLTAVRSTLGWVMQSELVLVQNGCAQFSSHASGDVAFGPDGKLYASAGDGASFKGQDYGQANAAGYTAACPGDPTNEGGSLRAQDQRSSGDALSVDGTIFRLDPDTGLSPTQATAGQWLVALGQRNPWRFTFRQGREQLWSVDVGSSNWEEINRLVDAPTTALTNRGWPCYEGTTGQSTRNTAWDALDKPLCEGLYTAQGNDPQTVQPPVYAYPTTNSTRTATVPLTPGENCPAVSSSMSGIAFSQLGTDWPAAYQDALYFADYLRGCVWRMGKDDDGQPDPSDVHVFVEGAGAPVDLLPGPGGDLYYVDYGAYTEDGYVAGSGGLRRISPARAAGDTPPAATPTPAATTTTLTVRSAPAKVKIKVAGQRHPSPYAAQLAPGTRVKLVAPGVHRVKGARWVFSRWQGVTGKSARKRQLTLTVGTTAVTVKAVYRRTA